MNQICPFCERITDTVKVKRYETYNVRGEEIEVLAEFFVCSVCEGEFDDPKSKDDIVEQLYKKYQRLWDA